MNNSNRIPWDGHVYDADGTPIKERDEVVMLSGKNKDDLARVIDIVVKPDDQAKEIYFLIKVAPFMDPSGKEFWANRRNINPRNVRFHRRP
jgi:hypothetical protein